MNKGVRICLDLTRPNTQTVFVRIIWNPTECTQFFSLPAWTPGSYTIRDHVQFMHSVNAKQNNKNIEIKRLSVNTWQLESSVNLPLELEYEIEARSLTVRTSYMDNNFASLCLASILVEVKGFKKSQYLIEINKPINWDLVTPLKGNGVLQADNFDELVDSPIHLGNFDRLDFSVRGYAHQINIHGTTPQALPKSLLSDISRICETTCNLIQTDPPSGDRYQFILLLLDQGYGGLEHDNSCVLHYSWKRLCEPSGYRKLLQLIGHEYLHQWNIRRLRPDDYIIYNYNEARISDTLWFVEGVTSYFDLVLPYIAGLSKLDDLLEDFSDEIKRFYSTNGRKIQTLNDSSREAWVKLYKSTKASLNTQISYYNYGTIIALCLDIKLRIVGSSLASILRQMWKNFGESSIGYRNHDIFKLINSLDISISSQLESWLDTTDTLELEPILSLVGLTLSSSSEILSNIGLELNEQDDHVNIERVDLNSPAQAAGLVSGDILISINEFHIRSIHVSKLVFKNFDEYTILYSRTGRIYKTKIQGITIKENACQVSINQNANKAQKEFREKWLEFF